MKEENKNDQMCTLLSDLFETAKVNGGLDYLYTLVRISGISSEADPLVELYELRRLNKEQIVPEHRFVKQSLECVNRKLKCPTRLFLMVLYCIGNGFLHGFFLILFARCGSIKKI